MRTHTVGVGAVEERRVGCNAEASSNCGANAFQRDIVAALTADGEVVMLALAVDVNGEREILARRKEVQLLFEQKSVGAHVDVLLARDEAGDDLRIFGCNRGSPPGIETIGAPHSSTARKHSSGESSALRMCAGY